MSIQTGPNIVGPKSYPTIFKKCFILFLSQMFKNTDLQFGKILSVVLPIIDLKNKQLPYCRTKYFNIVAKCWANILWVHLNRLLLFLATVSFCIPCNSVFLYKTTCSKSLPFSGIARIDPDLDKVYQIALSIVNIYTDNYALSIINETHLVVVI